MYNSLGPIVQDRINIMQLDFLNTALVADKPAFTFSGSKARYTINGGQHHPPAARRLECLHSRAAAGLRAKVHQPLLGVVRVRIQACELARRIPLPQLGTQV